MHYGMLPPESARLPLQQIAVVVRVPSPKLAVIATPATLTGAIPSLCDWHEKATPLVVAFEVLFASGRTAGTATTQQEWRLIVALAFCRD